MSDILQSLDITAADLRADPDYIYLSTLLMSEYYLQCLDNIKGTRYYKGHLRNGCNLVATEIRNELFKDLPLVMGIDDGNLYKISDFIESLMHEVTLMRPEHIGVVVAMIKKYKENPKDILDYLGIGIVDEEPKTHAA